MAECNTSRCSYERRLLRRELQKWSKEILYVIGLERLAEELMGAQKWKIFVEPFTDLESKNPDDWYPEETCYICNAKRLPPYDPASGIIPIVDGYSSLRIDTDDHSTSSDQGTAPGSSPSCSSALSPWYVTALTSQPVSVSPTVLDQPLDLSLRPPSEELNTPSSLNSLLKVPQIPLKPGQRKRVDGNSKRSYTEEELQAALRDIQSGKLGTRRAAVIYGIPRSTLRNKVYKLANESKSRAHCRVTHGAVRGKVPAKSLKLCYDLKPEVADSNSKHNTVSASESLRQLLKHTITQKALGSAKAVDSPQNADDNQNNVASSEDAEPLQTFETLDYHKALAPVLSRVFANIHHLALGRCKENLSNQSLSALKDDLKLPILPDLIHRLAEERIELERDCFKSHESTQKSEADSSEALPHVILKVPSFKAAPVTGEIPETSLSVLSSPNSPGTSSHNLSGNKGIAVSLKELIARSISQKTTDSSSAEEPNTDSDRNKHVGSSTSWSIQGALKQHTKDISSMSSSESSKVEKRTRPKRGRYRNYDRDNLARAVRAVQKGEMSVHRAGTFYGVPHSTLEYKVKERHLLRPRKREIFNNSSLTDISEPGTDTNYDMLAVHRKDVKSSFKQLNVNHNGLKTESEENHRPPMGSFPSHFSLWQSMPFFSLDFPQLGSSNFFASQMMRKLQENARLQEHEESQKNSKTQELGILESLIKTTLERPTTPESNKSFAFASELSETPSRETASGK